MTKLVTLDINGNKSCEATGHPSNCTEPVPGEVSQFESETNSVTVTNSSGDTSRLATEADANLQFSSHAHDYSVTLGCHQNNSHKIIPSVTSSSVKIDGSPVFIKGNGVATDPDSGGNVNILSGSVNNSLIES